MYVRCDASINLQATLPIVKQDLCRWPKRNTNISCNRYSNFHSNDWHVFQFEALAFFQIKLIDQRNHDLDNKTMQKLRVYTTLISLFDFGCVACSYC